MSDSVSIDVPADLVRAAIHAAEERGDDVASVPLTALAAAAGISRSTLLRRVGGSRQALDEAVRATGVDPGGRQPVRDRAVAAAAQLISELGLTAVTLAAVADTAGCSVHSLYAVFGGRDGLLAATYEQYSPILDFEAIAGEHHGLHDTVRAVYRALIASLGREPRVAPAMLAELFSRPAGPSGRLFGRYFPRVLSSIGGWLDAEVRAGRIRELPIPLLIQQLMGPMAMHLLLRPVLARELEVELPGVDETCAVFADAFVRAVATDDSQTDDVQPEPRQPGRTIETETEE